MPNVTDHELDKLFQEAADHTSPEFDPQDWEKLSKRLDQEDRAAFYRRSALNGIVSLVVISALWSVWNGLSPARSMSAATNTNTSSKQELLQENNAVNGDPINEKLNDSLASATLIETQPRHVQEDTEAISKKTDEGISLQDSDRTDKIRNKKNKQAVRSHGDQPGHGALHVTSAIPSLPQNKAINKDIKKLSAFNSYAERSGTSSSGVGVIENVNGKEIASPAGDRENGYEVLSVDETDKTIDVAGYADDDRNNKIPFYNRRSTWPVYAPIQVCTDQLALPVHYPSGNIKDIQAAFKREDVRRPRWFIKLLISPDFSSINYGSMGKTGINAGLLAEYNLKEHIAFSTGMIWSKKLYDTKNPDKSYGYGGQTMTASFLDGDCRVLDIPINVTYYFSPHSRTNFFVTAGFSSYIMLKEQYVFTVSANNHDYYYSEDFTNENNEWFSMLNLSVGVQRQIRERFWMQVEPFLKAPIAGVGEGKVNLVSAGAFLSLKYQLHK